MKRLLILVFALLFMTITDGVAQSARLKAANRQFENYAYLNAIRLYEEFLRLEKKIESPERKEALTKLAYSYRRMQDTRNAERVYEVLVKDYNELESETYLYYAQAMAGNGKYRDSQKMYSKYGEMQTADLRGKRFTVSYMDMSRFYQDSSSYKVEYLSINSRQADFSPMYYKNGLVFISARNESGAIKRVYGWNQTPFLDLYFVPDTAELHSPTSADLRVLNQSAGLGGANAGKENNDKVVTEDQPLTPAEVFSRTLNTKYHEGPAVFFKGEQKMIFTRNNYNKGKFRESAEGINKLKLYTADLDKNAHWGSVKEVPFNSNEYSCGHPALSPDNKLLYFVSDMPGGFGGTDLYVVEYRDGQWGTPVNMGKDINTEGNEMFPYIDESGNLYFSSDGHEGMGGLDVFFVEMKDGIPSRTIENLGAPINSEKDDFGLICTNNRSSGYFSSNRKRGVSDDNIYYFRRSCKQLQVVVFDSESKTPLEAADVRTVRNGENRELKVTGMDGAVKLCVDANVEYEFKAVKEGYMTNSVSYSTKSVSANQTKVVIYLEKSQAPLLTGVVKSELTNQPIAGAKVTLRNKKDKSEKSIITGNDGRYEFNVKPGADHEIVASKDKYTTNEGNTLTKVKAGKGPKAINNDLGMIAEGDIFRLDNIYYDLNQFFIRPDAAKEIDTKVIPYLKKFPKLRIEIRSHTDSRANDDYNLRLSENRARAVVDYLVTRGISPSRLVAKGYGETELINNCKDGSDCTESQHQQNRRTEFKVLAVK
jgi:outer membrane protein OmpA-like peptidoglycan-associated protein